MCLRKVYWWFKIFLLLGIVFIYFLYDFKNSLKLKLFVVLFWICKMKMNLKELNFLKLICLILVVLIIVKV